MALFNGATQGIVLASPCWIINGGGIEQHPVIVVTIGVDLAVNDGVQWDRTAGKRLKACHRGDFAPTQSLRWVWGGQPMLSLGFTQGQGFLSRLLAFANALGSMQSHRFGVERWWPPWLEAQLAACSQTHDILVDIHIAACRNQHLNSPLLFAATDLGPVDETAVHNQSLEDAPTMALDKLLD